MSSLKEAPQALDGLTDLEVQRPGVATEMTVFWGLIVRDARVLRRNIPEFLGQTLMQPLLFVFVFTYVFPKIGENFVIGHGITFATLLVPGLIGTAALFSGISSVATPLSIDFGATMEIEDRALSPIAVWAIGLEKILWGAVQALLSALIVFPLARPTLAATFTLLFVLAMQEVSSSILLYTSRSTVLSVAVFDLWEAGNVNALAALSVLQLAVTFAVLAFVAGARQRAVAA